MQQRIAARLTWLWSMLRLAKLLTNEAAAIAPMMALMLIPISGAVAVGLEQSEWYYFQRSMQNAADASAIAAAINNSNGTTNTSTYQSEAASVARSFGYVNGSNDATVGTTVVACPASVTSGATCYQTQITTVVPLTFSRMVGFTGNAAYGAGRGESILALAVAVTSTGNSQPSCLWTLSTGSSSFTSNGGPKPDLSGCNILSNGGETCNGHDLGADYGIVVAPNTDSGCGGTSETLAAQPADPFAPLASHIPANPCSTYPAETLPQGKVKTASTIAANTLNTATTSVSSTPYCGDVVLSGNVTLTGSNVLVIENGTLDTNGFTLSTASGAAATIIFTGTAATGYSHYPTNSTGAGALSISAPTSGTWTNMAIYQNPALTSGVSFSYAGNTPTWNISGLVYFPNANVTFSGAVNKNGTGSSCFGMVANTILVNGTGYIFGNDTGCAPGSNNLPGTPATRTKLVA